MATTFNEIECVRYKVTPLQKSGTSGGTTTTTDDIPTTPDPHGTVPSMSGDTINSTNTEIASYAKIRYKECNNETYHTRDIYGVREIIALRDTIELLEPTDEVYLEIVELEDDEEVLEVDPLSGFTIGECETYVIQPDTEWAYIIYLDCEREVQSRNINEPIEIDARDFPRIERGECTIIKKEDQASNGGSTNTSGEFRYRIQINQFSDKSINYNDISITTHPLVAQPFLEIDDTGKVEFWSDNVNSIHIKSNDTERTYIQQISVDKTDEWPVGREADRGKSLDVRINTLRKHADIEVYVDTIIPVTIPKPTVQYATQTDNPIADTHIHHNIKDSSVLTIPVTTQHTERLTVYLNNNSKDIPVNRTVNRTEQRALISISSEWFNDSVGIFKGYVIPNNRSYGDGEPMEFTVNAFYVDRTPIPMLYNIAYPKEITGPDFVGTDVDFNIEWNYKYTDLVKVYVNNYDPDNLITETDKDKITLNVKEVISKSNIQPSSKTTTFKLYLIPYSSTDNLKGEAVDIDITFNEGRFSLQRSDVIDKLLSVFTNNIDTTVFEHTTSNLLNHFLHIGDGDNKLISNWAPDTSNNSIIVKLYEPLPTAIQTNTQVWISKIQSNPIIETITITGTDDDYYPSLLGPDFSIAPDNPTGYKVYTNTTTRGDLDIDAILDNRRDKSIIDTSGLPIEYIENVDDSIEEHIYQFQNFINFSSAEERAKNYKYKIEVLDDLLEQHETLTSGSQSWQDAIHVKQNADKTKAEIIELVRSFDGFEGFLYQNDYKVENEAVWYGNLINQAIAYDKNNPNYIVNNIPRHIAEDFENIDFLLLLDMVGQHFDVLWLYISNIKHTKRISEKQYNSLVNNTLAYHTLKSIGLDLVYPFNREQMLPHVKRAANEVLARILNNSPYILKHKGTRRAMHAIMACYGIPKSLLTIMEFGGPQDPDREENIQFTFDDRTASVVFNEGSEVEVAWKEYAPSGKYPKAIEIRFNTEKRETQTLLSNGTHWRIDITPTEGAMGTVDFYISGSTELYSASVGPLSIYDGEYEQLLINQTGSDFDIYVGESTIGGTSLTVYTGSVTVSDSEWDSGDELTIGTDYIGKVDEFRLWTTPLDIDSFRNHTLFPDAIDGRSLFSSTEDLIFRLDFERPQPLDTNDTIKNVAINTGYGETHAVASGFSTVTNYPFNYYPYERTVIATIPSYGFTYTDKVRFEDAELIDDLSYKKRATRKSFDMAPIDSNRLGLFLSPNRELNLDVIKAFGGKFDIHDYIGDPKDLHSIRYTELGKIRRYYFKRLNRNVNEYVQLSKSIDKSLFENMENLAPARAKVSKGLLIEPHILERSKAKWDKPVANYKNLYTVIDADKSIDIQFFIKTILSVLTVEDTTEVTATPLMYNAHIIAEDYTELNADYLTFGAVITYDHIYNLTGTYLTYQGIIDTSVIFKQTIIGEAEGLCLTSLLHDKSSTFTIPFLTDFTNGWSRFKDRAFLLKREKETNVVTKYTGAEPGKFPGETEIIPMTKTVYEVSFISGSEDPVFTDPSIITAEPIDGYFRTHYRYTNTNRHWTAIHNLFYKGCKQTDESTPDGLPPVQTFITNPNILRVADTGRGSGEPILRVD